MTEATTEQGCALCGRPVEDGEMCCDECFVDMHPPEEGEDGGAPPGESDAPEGERGLSESRTKLYHPSRPNEIADTILQASGRSQKWLRHWRDGWYRWNGSYYESCSIEPTINNALVSARMAGKGEETKPYPTTRNAIADVKKQLTIKADWDGEVNQWIVEPDDLAGKEVFVTPEGIYDVAERMQLEPDNTYFALATCGCVPRQRPHPRWDSFLDEIGLEEDEVCLLQEFMGLCLVPDTRYQKILALIGMPRSGKGTILRVIQRMLGPAYTATSPSAMASPFGARDLIGKLVCGMSDARFSGRMDLCTERLLQISGEDTILIDRKHKDSVTARLNTRIIIASNNEVRLPDESGTIASRILTIRFNRSFLDREDMNLERDLAAEIDGIADWALDGLDSLRARGRFAEPASSLAERERCQRNSSPVISFIEECLVVDANVKVERGLLYRHWIEWADKSGHQRSSRTKFLSQLRALGYGEKKTSSARYITGLDLPGAFI